MREAGEEPTRQGGGRSSIGRKKADCPICRRGRPRDVVAVLQSAWVSAPSRAALPGYVAVVAKRHVVEPFELPAPSGFAFWRDVLLVAKALADLLSPPWMSYENHRNTQRSASGSAASSAARQNAKALADLFSPVKMNFEIPGDTKRSASAFATSRT